MKKVAIIALLIALCGAAAAQAPPGSMPSDQAREAEIRKVYATWVEAWNRHDVPAMSAIWALDGDMLEPDGRHADKRSGVAKLFEEEHTSVFKTARMKLAIDSVWFIKDDVALADGTYELDGVRGPEGKDLPTRKGHFSTVWLRENGKWWVTANRTMIPVQLIWRPQ